jgi:hypothetical protein
MRSWDSARQDLFVAIPLDPDNASFYRSRAQVRRAKGDVEGALQDLNEAIRSWPTPLTILEPVSSELLS